MCTYIIDVIIAVFTPAGFGRKNIIRYELLINVWFFLNI